MSDKKVSSILREIGTTPDLTQDEINDLRYILAHILGTEKAKLILHTDRELTNEELAAWEKGSKALIAGKNPVHYIINRKNFMGLDFFVDERVLIPRFDTEILVEAAMEEMEKLSQDQNLNPEDDDDGDKDEKTFPSLQVLELCTGSGAIPISIIHHQKKIPFHITALDISEDALQVANINRKELLTHEEQKRLKLIQSDLFENVGDSKFDLILANPPYVTHQEYATLDEKVKKEPMNALVAENEGLFFYEKILKEGKKYLNPEKGTIIFEIGSQQGSALLAMARDNGYLPPRIIPDYAGHPRVATIHRGGDASF